MKRNSVIKSLIYKFMERSGTQGITFIINIILARILSPQDYGLLAMLTVFIAISNVFVQGGFSTALIQKKNADNSDFSSVFYISLGASLFMYLVLFIFAPFIALYYEMPDIRVILRVLALTLIFGAFNSIQIAKVSRDMQFSKLMNSSLSAVIVSGLIGICMAYNNFGVWALVGQQLSNQILICVIMWFSVKWRPALLFNKNKVKKLFSFGWKLLASNLIDTLYNNLYSLVIGKKYSAEMLGYYNRGKQFPQMIIENINGTIQSVMLPALSAEQDNKERIKTMMRRSIKTSSYFVMPAMAGLIALASPLVSVLLTDKWLPCVPFLQLTCITYASWPIHTANLQAINAVGRSDLFLKLEIVKKTYGLITLFITVFCFDSVIAIVIGGIVTMPIGLFVNAFPNKKLLGYSFSEQLKDIAPYVLLSCVMGLITYLCNFLNLNNSLTLFVGVLTGTIFYFFISYLLRFEVLMYMLNIVKEYLSKKSNIDGGV